MESSIRILKECSNLSYQEKQKCFEYVKDGISNISDNDVDAVLTIIKQEFIKDQRHSGIILEILCVLIPQLKVIHDKHFTQLTDIAKALLRLLISTCKFKALTLQVSCINVLSLYPDLQLISVIKNHNDLVFEMLKGMAQSPDTLKISILGMVNRFFNILPEEEKNNFGKKGLSVWLTVVVPLLFSETNLLKQPALEIIETVNPLLNISDYLNNAEFIEFVSLIRDKEKYPSQMVSLLKNGDASWDRVWICFTKLMNKNLYGSSSTMNSLLWVLEIAFKSNLYRYKGFKCWKILIDLLNREELLTNRIKLLALPLNQIGATNENIISVKFEVWFHLLSLLKSNVESHCKLLLLPFLHFCYGAPAGRPKLYNHPVASAYPSLYGDIIKSLVEIFGHVSCNECEIKTNESGCFLTTEMFMQYSDDWKHSIKQCFKIIVFMLKQGEYGVVKQATCLYSSFLTFVKNNFEHSKYAVHIMVDISKDHIDDANVFDFIVKVFITLTLDKDVGFSSAFLLDKSVIDGRSPIDIIKNILTSSNVEDKDKLRGVINLNDKFKILIDHIIDQEDVASTLNCFGPNFYGCYFYSVISTALICKNIKIPELNSCIFWPIDKIFTKELVDEVTESWSLIYTSGKVNDDLNDKIIVEITSNARASNVSSYLLPMTLTKRLDSNSAFAINNEDICLLDKVLHQLTTRDKTFCIIRTSKYIYQYVKTAKMIRKDNPLSKPCLQLIVKFFKISVIVSSNDVHEILASILDEILTVEMSDFETIFDLLNLCENSVWKLLHEKLISNFDNITSNKHSYLTSSQKLKLKELYDESDKLNRIKKNSKYISAKKNMDKPLIKPPKQTKVTNNISSNGNSEDLVVIHPKWKFNPKKLTENQKEKLERRRDDIPALYQDMSQSHDDISLQSWQPHNYKTDSQDTSSQISDTTKKAEKILKEIPNTDVCPNIISSLLVSLSPNTAKMVNVEKGNANKKSKRNFNGNIENIVMIDNNKKQNIEKLSPLTFLNKTKQSKEDSTMDKGNLDNFVLSPNPADDLVLIQQKTNEIAKVPLVKINNNIDDRNSLTSTSIEIDRPTRVKKKPKKFDPDDHTIIKHRKSNESRKDFSLMKSPCNALNSSYECASDKIKYRRKSSNDSDEYLAKSLKSDVNLPNNNVPKSDRKVNRKRKFSIESNSSNVCISGTSNKTLLVQVESGKTAVSNSIDKTNDIEERDISVKNDNSSKMLSNSESNNYFNGIQMQLPVNSANNIYVKSSQTLDKVDVEAVTTGVNEKNSKSAFDNKQDLEKNKKSIPKKTKRINRLESQLEIDTIEGHPLLEKLKDKRSRLSRTIAGDKAEINSKDRRITQSKSTKREVQKLSQRGRRNSIDNSQISKKCQKTKTKEVQIESNKGTANTRSDAEKSNSFADNKTEDKCKNKKDGSDEIEDITKRIDESEHNAVVVAIDRRESYFSEDVIESSQDSSSSGSTAICTRIAASKAIKSDLKDDVTYHEPENNIVGKNAKYTCNTEDPGKIDINEKDDLTITAAQNNMEQTQMAQSNVQNTAEMDTLVLNTEDINNILQKSDIIDISENFQVEKNTEDADTEVIISNIRTINNLSVESNTHDDYSDTGIYSQDGQKHCNAEQMEFITNCDKQPCVKDVENIEQNDETTHDRSIISSPQKDDADERNCEFLNSTLDMSPIATCSNKVIAERTERNNIKDSSVLDANTSPDVFSMEKIALTNEVNNDSPPQVASTAVISSPGITSRYKKSKVAQSGRGARMLGLCVPDKANTLQMSIDKCFGKIADVDSKTKTGYFCATPPNRNFKMIYNATNDSTNNEMGRITNDNPNSNADDASDDCSDSDVAPDMLTFIKILPDANASPSASILKRKRVETAEDASSPVCKKKRVSFHDPPVSTTKYIECAAFSPHNSQKIKSPKSKGRKLEPYFDGIVPLNDNFDDETPDSVSFDKIQSQVVIENDVTNVDKKIYADLIDCSDSISILTNQLASSLWENSLKEELHGRVYTVGDFASLTEYEVSKLSIKTPKIETARNVLFLHHSKLLEMQSASKAIETGAEGNAGKQENEVTKTLFSSCEDDQNPITRDNENTNTKHDEAECETSELIVKSLEREKAHHILSTEIEENEFITEVMEESTQFSNSFENDQIQITNEAVSTSSKNDEAGDVIAEVRDDESLGDNRIKDGEGAKDDDVIKDVNISTKNVSANGEIASVESFLDNNSLNDVINMYFKRKEEKTGDFTPNDRSQLLKSLDFDKLYEMSGKDEEFMRHLVRIGNHNKEQYISHVIEEYSVNSLLRSLSDKDILNYIMQNNSTNNFLAMLGRSLLDKYERL